jgi:hypothetical protein
MADGAPKMIRLSLLKYYKKVPAETAKQHSFF